MPWKKPPQGPNGKEAAPQALLPPHPVEVTLGTSGGKPLILTGPAARRHLRVLGLSGSGKSKFLATLILQLLNQLIGVLLIDPAGDLFDDVVRTLWDESFFADQRAFERCILLEFGRPDEFVPFDVLSQPRPPHAVATSALEALHRTYRDIATGAPLIDSFIQYGCVCLIANRLPITKLPALLTDQTFCNALLQQVSDPQVHAYFRHVHDMGRRSGTLIESTLRRINLLTFNPELRYSLGAPHNLLRMREAMDQGTSFLISLAGLPAQSQRLLASLIAISTEEAALSREDLPEERRRPYTLTGDEYSMYSVTSAEAMERMLALTRKYGLQVIAANQTLSQMNSKIEGALQNALQIVFQTGQEDAAEIAARLFAPDPYRLKQHSQMRTTYMSVSEQRLELERVLTTLPPRTAYVRLEGKTLRFRSLGVPTPRCTREQLVALKTEYARRYLMRQSDIEREMATRGPQMQSTTGHYRPGGMVVDADPPAPPQPRSGAALPSPTQPPRRDTNGTRRARRQIPLDRSDQG